MTQTMRLMRALDSTNDWDCCDGDFDSQSSSRTAGGTRSFAI